MYNSLKYKLMRFMSGRYGNDKLNNHLLGLYFIVWILNVIIWSDIVSLVLDLLQLFLMIVIVYRMFSRNIYKRQKENQSFIKTFGNILPDYNLLYSKFRDRHTHIYKKCPNCKSVLRLKKIEGEHTARCPKCSEQVKVKIR